MGKKFKDAIKNPDSEEKAVKKGEIAVMSYHGKTEKGTQEIAEAVHAQSDASLYTFHGDRVASTKVTPTHSEYLTDIREHAKTAVSIHGHSRKGEDNLGREYQRIVYVTGGNEELVREIGGELEKKIGDDYHIETDPNRTPKMLRGVSKYNIVNKFEKKGVQIELPKGLRESDTHRGIVSDTIASIVDKYKVNKEYKKAA